MPSEAATLIIDGWKLVDKYPAFSDAHSSDGTTLGSVPLAFQGSPEDCAPGHSAGPDEDFWH